MEIYHFNALNIKMFIIEISWWYRFCGISLFYKEMIMTRTICVTALLVLLAGFSCERIDINADVPDCVRRMARSLRNEEVRNPPALISEWTLGLDPY